MATALGRIHSKSVYVLSMYVFFLLPLEGYAGKHMIDRFATHGSPFNGCHQKNYINSSTTMSQRDESSTEVIDPDM